MRAEVLFLFNHDAPHQVAHTAGVARALAAARPDVQVTCATATPAIRAHVAKMVGEGSGVAWLDIALPPWMEAMLALPNRLAPVRRLKRLDHHADRLRRAAILVSAERTCLRLKRRWRAGPCPQFLFIPHGAGDRSVSYHPAMAEFDRILVSGPKVAREMVAHGIARPEDVTIVGYPKFDGIDPARRERFFDNDRPVLLYNPHFDPFLSSWYDHGPALLDWAASAEGQAFNLIFAPHIMLFRKRLHVSPEYRVARLRPALKASWINAPNIRVDVDSARLVDMSYTLSADAYVGDVSSQIYEFLIRPRPAFFLDRFTSDPRSREDPLHCWEAGDVVRSVPELLPLLARMDERLAVHEARQRAIFEDTFSVDPAHPAPRRAAQALAGMLASSRPVDAETVGP